MRLIYKILKPSGLSVPYSLSLASVTIFKSFRRGRREPRLSLEGFCRFCDILPVLSRRHAMRPIPARVVCMGCTPSTARVTQTDVLVDRFAPPPPIPVAIGAGVRQHHHPLSIVFIFGGPGSQKGLVIEELTARFDFISISVEDIVFNYLPSKVSNAVESIGEIQDMLRRDSGILTMDWIMSMISAKISTSMNQRFVIDIVPTLATILRSESYRTKTHDRSMENFERRHPIMFALELAVSDEVALLSAKNEGKENESGKVSTEMSQIMKGIDEIDKGRLEAAISGHREVLEASNGASLPSHNPEVLTQAKPQRRHFELFDWSRFVPFETLKLEERRLDQYHQCSESFLKYFARTKRVVKLTLFGPVSNLVTTVRDILVDFGFTTVRNNQQILVFSSEHDQDLDLEYYKLRKVQMREISKSSSDSLATQVATLQRYVTSHAQGTNLLIIMDNVKDGEISKSRGINFMERKREAYLDEFITDKKHEKQPKSRSRVSVNCISSTSQVFLFIEPFPTDLAQKISQHYNKLRDSPAATRDS
ncbi:unnamed protein product [Caenorhabditis auriculariae]|uniref:Uncharacterized protein n=1 Tax=Caenorhabditis auriculariae TaxID=2777116 RepID=A0A8S1HBJ5_9PELO|nr:unnamed protein product [Caenorhabditis auriculariae]